MTTRKQESEFRDETPLASDQSTVQRQKSLTDLLDEIESRAKPKERNLGHGIVQMTPGDPNDVPALVKALRQYKAFVGSVGRSDLHWRPRIEHLNKSVAQLLSTGEQNV